MRKIIDSILWLSAIVFCSIAMTLGVWGIAHADTMYTCENVTNTFGSGAIGCTDDPFTLTWDIAENSGYALGTPILDVGGEYTITFTTSGVNYPLLVYLSPDYGAPFEVLEDGVHEYTFSGADGVQIQSQSGGSFTGTLSDLVLTGGDPVPPTPADIVMATSSIDQVQQNYAEGYKLFLMTIALGVFIFKRR